MTKPANSSTPQIASVRALMNRLIDYAGLFPPAKLDMTATVANYAKYLGGEHAWMMGRLIVPVGRLDEFEQHAQPHLEKASAAGQEPWVLSAITSPADAPALAGELERIEAFNLAHEDAAPAMIDMIELRSDSAGAIDNALEIIPEVLFPFFEIPSATDPRGLIATLVEGDAGAKIRTGGITADLYPSPANVARFIAACAAANVPFKATAGMHHPLRRHSDDVKADEFGFINVFLAGCFAQTHELGEDELAELLAEQSPDAFSFTEDGIAWRKHEIETASIEDVRECFAASFGSCSFDEPIEGLRAMKLL
jgi:hypothetical protein